jgi:hypothetical protein
MGSLEMNFFRNRDHPCATKIAFQIAFCYQIGFGVKSDGTECHRWLQKSDKQPGDLMFEKEAV